jgi:hypothetical protein
MQTTETAGAADSAHRPIFVLRLQAAPDRDPIHGLRSLLKFALRRCGMRALSAREEHDGRAQ